MSVWDDQTQPDPGPITALGWLRAIARGIPVALVVFGGLAIMLGMRAVERPLCGMRRPVTPYLTVCVCRFVLWVMGFQITVTGTPMRGQGGQVANHATWLDIFVLNARQPLYFVAKSEVAGWPGIGWLARATGTLFIRRDRREAKAQTALFEQRLMAGHRLLFFPEGTSTDGRRVLTFKPTLFQAYLAEPLRDHQSMQAVSVNYHAPKGRTARFYGWWGDMDFAGSLIQTLAQAPQGAVELVYHPPLAVRDYPNRKSLAAALEAQVAQSHALRMRG